MSYKTSPDLLKALKSARLMLYAWKGSLKERGIGENKELEETIKQAEEAIQSAEFGEPKGGKNGTVKG